MIKAGYQIIGDVLPERECDAVLSALLAAGKQRGHAGERHLMTTPEVSALAADPRLLRMAQEALGDPAVPYRATLFEKSGRANWLVAWHQDKVLPLESRIESDEWGPWSTKAGVLYAQAPGWALSRVIALRIHLDPSASDNGPLRVIPGSHRAGVLTDEEIFRWAHQERSVECLVPRGGVLAMRPLLIHASSKASSANPRRVLHIEYADSLTLRPGIRLAIA